MGIVVAEARGTATSVHMETNAAENQNRDVFIVFSYDDSTSVEHVRRTVVATPLRLQAGTPGPKESSRRSVTKGSGTEDLCDGRPENPHRTEVRRSAPSAQPVTRDRKIPRCVTTTGISRIHIDPLRHRASRGRAPKSAGCMIAMVVCKVASSATTHGRAPAGM
jgi:hypothetical protein